MQRNKAVRADINKDQVLRLLGEQDRAAFLAHLLRLMLLLLVLAEVLGASLL